jgi:hypothetical protein
MCSIFGEEAVHLVLVLPEYVLGMRKAHHRSVHRLSILLEMSTIVARASALRLVVLELVAGRSAHRCGSSLR